MSEREEERVFVVIRCEFTFSFQVIDVGFPDHHNPPLDLLFQIIVTMEKWISADQDHVAVVHCKGEREKAITWILESTCLSVHCTYLTFLHRRERADGYSHCVLSALFR